MFASSTLATVLQAPFLIEGQALQMLYAEVAQLLKGQSGAAGPERPVKQLGYHALTPHAAALGVLSYAALDEVPAGSIAVHTVAGVMMPEDSWYSVGTQTIGQRMQQADAHPSIVGHVGVFNTPGGSTMGLENFAGVIAGTQKPFVSLLQQACSAGYWGASGGNVLMLAGRTAMCGSIGTMAQFLDFTGYFKQLGIETITINATKSTNKNAAFQAALDGDPEPLRAEILDPLNEVFLSTVTANRGDKIPAKQRTLVTSGKVFVGQANIDNGLADLMGSLDDALALAQQLADEAPSNDSSSTPNSMFGKNKFSAVAALAGLAATALTAELVAAANDELEEKGVTGAQLITEAAYTDLTATAGRVEAAEQSVTDLTAANTRLTTELTTATQQATDLKAEVARLGKQPGEKPTNPQALGNDTDATPPKNAIVDPNAAHNLAAAAYFD